MARRKKGTRRDMGTRSVRLTFTLSVRPNRKITDAAWDSLQDVIDRFINDLDENTIFTTPVIQETTYSREVEVREVLSYE